MGWRDEKPSTQQIQLLALAIVLAQHPSGRAPTLSRVPDRRLPATVVQHMRRTVRQQHDISAHQFPSPFSSPDPRKWPGP